jgi:hypothetical protein
MAAMLAGGAEPLAREGEGEPALGDALPPRVGEGDLAGPGVLLRKRYTPPSAVTLPSDTRVDSRPDSWATVPLYLRGRGKEHVNKDQESTAWLHSCLCPVMWSSKESHRVRLLCVNAAAYVHPSAPLLPSLAGWLPHPAALGELASSEFSRSALRPE